MEKRYMMFTNTVASLYQSIQKIRAMEMEHFNLKTGHVTCLLLLYHHPEGITHKKMTELCEMDKAAVSRYITTLRDRGFITDDTGSAKKYHRLIHLTETGKYVAKRTTEMVVRAVENGSASMAEDERIRFYDRLQEIADNLQMYISRMETEASE